MHLMVNMKHYNKYTLKYPRGPETEKSVFVALFFRLTMDPLLKLYRYIA